MSQEEPVPAGSHRLAVEAITRLASMGSSLAAAESVTGGLVAAALTSVPGSSVVVRGGVVAYAADLKASLLGVDPDRLAQRGPVDEEVAAQMARGVRRLLGADYAVATTGEAGPVSGSGAPVGTVFVAVAGPAGTDVSGMVLPGGRPQVRAAAVRACLTTLVRNLPQPGGSGPRGPARDGLGGGCGRSGGSDGTIG